MPVATVTAFVQLTGSAAVASRAPDLRYPILLSKTQSTDMSMATKANLKSSGREAALARRRALSNKGKQGLSTSGRARGGRPAEPSSAAQTATAEPELSMPEVSKPAPPLAQPAAPRPQARAGRPPSSPSQSSRMLARERRTALAASGRKAVRGGDRVRGGDLKAGVHEAKPTPASPKPGKECGCACNGEGRDRPSPRAETPRNGKLGGNGKPAPRNRRVDAALGAKSSGRMQALARRRALSGRGKGAGNSANSVAGMARQANPRLSGRELAQAVRAQRSSNGGAGERKSAPSGRMRPDRGAADQPWKVGASETASGQVVTGTKVGRSAKTTGDEPSTCRTVTGTEYMGADIFRAFCQREPTAAPPKVRVSATGHGNRVTGNEVGRSAKVTGDEPGTCKQVTGTEYLSPDLFSSFCAVRPEPGPHKVGVEQSSGGKPVSGNLVGRSSRVTGDEQGAGFRLTGTQYTAPSDIGRTMVPPKVGISATLAGRTVTGTRVGSSARVTGDEPGSCRIVTGDEYIDRGQYEQCGVAARPEPASRGPSTTLKGQRVSGTQSGRSDKVTGDEPGTCKAITGTPYAGLEQAGDYCAPEQQQEIRARARPLASTPGPVMTGIQPGIDSASRGRLTGAAKGACEPLTGTPYVGADQFAAACDTKGALPGDGDFPQPLDAAPWQGFSLNSPARQAFEAAKVRRGAVTGTVYESDRNITGPFGMGTGKITGTEQFRFDARQQGVSLLIPEAPSAEPPAGSPAERPRITGEGQAAGAKITGDDWERGDRVTGTEGTSARRRNPTRPGPIGAMPPLERKRNEEVSSPVSRVTGSAGNTERGALITYSGGARG
jgi:hypothetical protein